MKAKQIATVAAIISIGSAAYTYANAGNQECKAKAMYVANMAQKVGAIDRTEIPDATTYLYHNCLNNQ